MAVRPPKDRSSVVKTPAAAPVAAEPAAIKAPEETPPAPVSALPTWALSLAIATGGAVGLSGALYAVGFVALHSHMSFWGLWSGPSDDSADLVSEGGRLLYHLAFVVIELLDPFSGFAAASFQIFLLAALLLWWIPPAACQRLSGKNRYLKALGALLTLLGASAAAVWGLVVLRALGSILEPSGLLDAATSIPSDVSSWLCRSSDVYFARVTDIVGLAALLATAMWSLRLNASMPLRALVVLDAALLVAAIGLLPAIYGRLVLPPEYVRIEFSRDKAHPVERVMLRAKDDQWIVWNVETRRTEVIKLRDDETVVLGTRRHLAPALTSTGAACGKEH